MFKSLQCNRDKGHQFYANGGDIFGAACPIAGCDGTISCRRVVKTKPKRRGGVERYEVPHFADSLLSRTSREHVIAAQQEYRDLERKDELKFRLKLAQTDEKFAYNLAADPDFDNVSETELGDDNLAYLPGEPFKPSMRFTQSSGARFAAGQRDLTTVATDAAHRKMQSGVVKNSAVRGSTNTKMGQSAHSASGRGVQKGYYDAFRGDHEEWNHLIADCLGGPTEPHNLVAASAACNSFMLNIESCLRGKGHISLVVTAFCNAANIAEWIKYEIINKGKSKIYNIDATNHYFTHEDGKELRAEVLKHCK